MLTAKEPVLKKQQSQSQSQIQLKPPAPERLAESTDGHEEEIRPLAYRKWEEAGRPEGDGVEFWLVAEKKILRRR